MLGGRAVRVLRVQRDGLRQPPDLPVRRQGLAEEQELVDTLNACNEAAGDLRKAENWVTNNLQTSLDQLSGCRDKLLDVICAYHFPACLSDQEAFTQICYNTCQDMYNSCVPNGENCLPGSNTTLVDDNGNLLLDGEGNPQYVPCEATNESDVLSNALDTGNQLGNALSSGAQSAAATGEW
eukprot:CAMPEP_0173426072 /NCGR_PEP_ID=MMETSP1357-20121228/5630_1 /TAXON_ID=77926 /ORGANISM="Hemiselmis rufescens, Strain PCC563" /LENGTH=180 /DNA_ID=CAMNT_0014389651 /DNA_START=123 /DNA_END=663 /DNA_ORIENTATION=-